MEEEGNSSILLSNSEPVASTPESSVEKPPKLFDSTEPSSSSTVQEPELSSAKEEEVSTASNVSLQMQSESADKSPPQSTDDAMVQNAADKLVQQLSTSDSVVHNSTSNISITADTVQTPEQNMSPSETVIPTLSGDRRPSGPLLVDVKRQRAREREERMRRHNSLSPDANSMGLVASKTNGTITNGVSSAGQHPLADNATFVGTRHKYSNRYDITAPDHKEKCCVVM